MAIEQPCKDKVRPVLDFRELNQYVECHTGSDVAICDDTIRKWRRLTGPYKTGRPKICLFATSC